MERTLDDLLKEAFDAGALDRWSEDGDLYAFHADSRVFRMRRAGCAGFLKALITRRHLDRLAVRVGADDVADCPRPDTDPR